MSERVEYVVQCQSHNNWLWWDVDRYKTQEEALANLSKRDFPHQYRVIKRVIREEVLP